MLLVSSLLLPPPCTVARHSGSAGQWCCSVAKHTHTYSGVICIDSSSVLLLKAAHCVSYPPPTLFM